MGLVKVEKRGKTAIVTIDNPPLNLFNLNLLKEIISIFLTLAKENSIRSIILTGGKNFSAGADIQFLGRLTTHSANDFSKI